MRFSSTEEYGLRCMLQMAKKGHKGMTTLVELAQKEKLTTAYVAKIMSRLRKGGLVQSIRGQSGGYQLSRPPQEINVNDVLEALSGKFFAEEDYCETPAPEHLSCVHTMDCAVRSLWMGLSMTIGNYLRRCRLTDLVTTEPEMERWLSQAQKTALAQKSGGPEAPRQGQGA